MAKHFMVTFRATPGAQPEEIRVKAPTEAKAIERLNKALGDRGKADAVETSARELTEE